MKYVEVGRGSASSAVGVVGTWQFGCRGVGLRERVRHHPAPAIVSGPRPRGNLVDNRQMEAGTRLAAIGELFDPATFRALGGHRCRPGLAVLGGGSRRTNGGRLAGRAGRTAGLGRWPPTSTAPGWRPLAATRRCTVRPPRRGCRPAAQGPFDLIHARLVLVHLPDGARWRPAVAGLLRPGGWLVVEDADPALQPLACIDERGPDQELANRIRQGFRAAAGRPGRSTCPSGGTLPGCSAPSAWSNRGRGLLPGDRPGSSVWERATVEQTRAGWWPTVRRPRRRSTVTWPTWPSGRLDVATAPMVSTRGRRPLAGHAD